jgi:hypothetical protein
VEGKGFGVKERGIGGERMEIEEGRNKGGEGKETEGKWEGQGLGKEGEGRLSAPEQKSCVWAWVVVKKSEVHRISD